MNARQVIAGLGWSSLATGISVLAQFGFLAVLARLLAPTVFGLMAISILVLRLGSFLAQTGFAQALIQKPDLTAEDTSAALLWALALGALPYAAICLVAPLLAGAFSAPELPSLLAVFGFTLPLAALGSLPAALLRRQGRFKRLTAIEVTSLMLGNGAVGIACASAGWGVWSLVTGMLVQQCLALVLGFAATRYPLAWPVRREALSGVWKNGAKYSLIGFLEFIHANIETLYIGRFVGKPELGIYNRAIAVSNLPVEHAVNALNKVLFPALAAMQHDRARLADGFLMLLLGVGLLSTAVACGIAAAAPDVVALLLGTQWGDSAPIVAVVAFAVPPMFIYVSCGITLDSVAALAPKLRLQIVMVCVKLVLVLAAAGLGMQGIALAVVAGELLRALLGLHTVARVLHIRRSRVVSLVSLFIVEGLAVHAMVDLVHGVARDAGLSLPWRLLAEALCGGGTVLGGLMLLLFAFPGYRPLQRFDALRSVHDRVLSGLQIRSVQP